MLGIPRGNTNDTIITAQATDLSLPVEEEDVLALLVLGVAEAPLDVHLRPLLVELLAAPGAGPACSSRSSDVASAAPEIRRCQHHLHLAPLHLNCSTSSLASSVVGSRTPTDKWRNSDGGLESLLRVPTTPTTATARTRQEQAREKYSKHENFTTSTAAVLLSPVPVSCLLVVSLN